MRVVLSYTIVGNRSYYSSLQRITTGKECYFCLGDECILTRHPLPLHPPLSPTLPHFFLCVGGVGGRSGEVWWARGEVRWDAVGNWHADLNEIMVHHAWVVLCVVCLLEGVWWWWFQAMGGIVVCLLFNRILHAVCACLLDLYHG